jgi:outer membrane protein
LTWDPFDVVGVRGRVISAQADVETQKQTLIQQSQTVVSDIANAYLNIKSSEERITTSQAEVTNATEGLRIAEGQFKAGVATFVTVTDAEANLSLARTDLLTAQASLQLARSAMEHALGKAL